MKNKKLFLVNPTSLDNASVREQEKDKRKDSMTLSGVVPIESVSTVLPFLAGNRRVGARSAEARRFPCPTDPPRKKKGSKLADSWQIALS